ncbi:hypothetical protein STTU_p0085 (plasmid) [Streptomyces sp. Tu6071]|nr:hypothetical protein STTU_p0085 [Streptomyces sp. Tu6071]
MNVYNGGGSPRARGRLLREGRAALRPRRIPALAGPTPMSAVAVEAAVEDPRVCGDHPTVVLPTDPARGPSPRVRGP